MSEQTKSKKRRRSPVFVDRPEVREVLDLGSNATLAAWVERGWCPPPDRWLTPQRPVWYRKEFERWLYGRAGDESKRSVSTVRGGVR